MNECIFCERIMQGTMKHVLMEDEHAVVIVDEHPYRKGNCVVIPKRHMLSISEMTPEENASAFTMITAIAKALEQLFGARKTYLLSISDSVRHIHYHVTPKLKGQASVGLYCFQLLTEAEGRYKPAQDECATYAKEIVQRLVSGD